MLRARALQDETGGFQAFIPLAFHPDNNQMRKLPAPSAADTLRVHAVARLMLDNIPHVKAFWIATGVEVAQTSLWFGVDDLDGTVQEEKIYHMAGARTPEAMTTREIARLITRRRPRAGRARHASTTSSHAAAAALMRQRAAVSGSRRGAILIVTPSFAGRLTELGFFVSRACEKFHKATTDANAAAGPDGVRERAPRRAPAAARALRRPVRRGDGRAHRRRQGRRSAGGSSSSAITISATRSSSSPTTPATRTSSRSRSASIPTPSSSSSAACTSWPRAPTC